MPVNVTNAAGAYTHIAKSGASMEPRGGKADPAGDFASLLKHAAQTAREITREGEIMSMKAIAGDANLTDVVTAVTSAEVTLQTVTAIRDKVIQAYQDIIRMPL